MAEKKEDTLWVKAVADATKDVADGRVPSDLTDRLDKVADVTGDYLQAGTKTLAHYAARPFTASLKGLGLDDEFEKFKESKVAIAVGHEVNRYVRDFLEKSHSILTNWYKDTITLCCLIRLMGAIHQKDIKKNNLLVFLRKLKAIIGAMMDLLSVKLRESILGNFDILTFSTEMLIAVGIAAINAGLDTWADDLYKDITGALGLRDKEGPQGRNETIAKCIPFDELLDVTLNFFIGDYGILEFFKRYIRDFMNKLRKSFRQTVNEIDGSLGQIKTVEFLRRMCNIIDIIIRAVENGEMCLEMDFDTVKQEALLNPDDIISSWYDTGEAGAPIVTREGIINTKSVAQVLKESGVMIPSENEMRSFYKRNMDYSDEMTNQAMTTHSNALDCGQSVTPEVYDIYTKMVDKLTKATLEET